MLTDNDTPKGKLWDYLINNEIATREELCLVTNINGYNIETMESILYSKTGYRSLEQIQECEPII